MINSFGSNKIIYQTPSCLSKYKKYQFIGIVSKQIWTDRKHKIPFTVPFPSLKTSDKRHCWFSKISILM